MCLQVNRNADVMPLRIYLLNELSIWPFLLDLVLRRRICVLAVLPYFFVFSAIFRRIVSVTQGRLIDIAEIIPDLKECRGSLLHYHDVFGRTEVWHNQRYGFAESGKVGEYAFPYKHVTCNWVVSRYHSALVLERLRQHSEYDVQVVGLDQETMALDSALRRQDSMVPGFSVMRLAGNAVITLIHALVCWGWVVSRVRRNAMPASDVFFAADYHADARDRLLYEEMAEGGRVLLVMRNNTYSTKGIDALKKYETVQNGDGYFTLRQGVSAACLVFSDLIKLLIQFNSLSPDHFHLVSAMVFKRIRYRALFNRYRIRFFFGRDDYNVEHILRRQELNRVGGMSLGVNHSIPNVARIQPMWRYISFDVYYVFGRWVHQALYSDTWARDMQVVPVGSFGFTRAQHAQYRARSPMRDVVVFTDNAAGKEKAVDFVRGLAGLLSDRKILLQVRGFRQAANKDFIAACCRDLENVSFHSDAAYDLFLKAGYAISDPSAVILEAIQAGLVTYFMDIMPVHPSCMFRDFPDLVVTSPEQVAERIRANEDGSHPYPIDKFGDLIDLEGHIYLDEVRHTVGLPRRGI